MLYSEVDVSNKDQRVAMVKAVADANDGNVHLLVNCMCGLFWL